MKALLLLAVTVALAVPAVSMQSAKAVNASDSSASEEQLKTMPALDLKDFDGKSIRSDAFKGSVLVLDFWATWCGPCIAEIPLLNRLQEKYAAVGVKVIGVTLASGEPKEVKPFITRNKMRYTVLMGDDDQAYDFNLVGFPTTYLITKDLKIYRKYIGAGPGKSTRLEADIQSLLKQN
ncbi:MAG: TlpA disulfide reductase family protein [Acidobacteriota bacterium]